MPNENNDITQTATVFSSSCYRPFAVTFNSAKIMVQWELYKKKKKKRCLVKNDTEIWIFHTCILEILRCFHVSLFQNDQFPGI